MKYRDVVVWQNKLVNPDIYNTCHCKPKLLDLNCDYHKINLLKLFIKKCYGCHEELEVDNFKFAKTIGPRKLCIECYKKRQREYSFKKRAKERKNLHDNYIKKLLTRRGNLKAEDIPPQLIELKRAEIKARRFLKKAAQYERT